MSSYCQSPELTGHPPSGVVTRPAATAGNLIRAAAQDGIPVVGYGGDELTIGCFAGVSRQLGRSSLITRGNVGELSGIGVTRFG